MTGHEFTYIHDTLNLEGIDYGLNHYSDFENIKDPEFHRLWNEYRQAREQLLIYIRYEE